jgi:hypothetical protein
VSHPASSGNAQQRDAGNVVRRRSYKFTSHRYDNVLPAKACCGPDPGEEPAPQAREGEVGGAAFMPVGPLTLTPAGGQRRRIVAETTLSRLSRRSRTPVIEP